MHCSNTHNGLFVGLCYTEAKSTDQEAAQEKITNLETQLDELKRELSAAQAAAAKAETALDSLQQPPDSPVTPLQAAVYRSITMQMLHNNSSGLITISGQRGQSIHMQKLVTPRVGSADSSARSLARRSQFIEGITQHVSTSKGDHENLEQSPDVLKQQSSLVRRNYESYRTAASHAGIKLHAKFSPEEAVALKSKMPWTLWKAIKRQLKSVLGYDAVGTIASTRQAVQDRSFEHEYGTFTVGDKVGHFIRITNVQQVLERSMKTLHDNGLLRDHVVFPRDQLRILLTGDKGGTSTKLMMVFLNAAEPHSVKVARLLAMFSGVKDTREAIATVFGPIYAQVNEVLDNTASMELPCPPPYCPKRPHEGDDEDNDDETASAVPEEDLDHSNLYRSLACQLCRSEPYQPAENQSRSTYTHGRLILSGDWEYLSHILGTTGPNGLYFCNCCYATLHNQKKGVPDSAEENTYTPRLFSELFQHSTEYASDTTTAARDKAKKHKNCEATPLVKLEGKVADSLSCMPLHLSLGLGYQALQLLEKEAQRLDDKIKSARGEGTDTLRKLFAKQDNLEALQADIMQQTEEAEAQATALANEISQCISDSPECFQQAANGRFPDSADSVDARMFVASLKRQGKELEKSITRFKAQHSQNKKEIAKLQTQIVEAQGPVWKDLDNVLNSFDLKRQVYHKGALLGKDVNLLLRQENYKKACGVLKERHVQAGGVTLPVGSADLEAKFLKYFLLLSKCHSLYSPSRPLCKHEVVDLTRSCESFGKWFPPAFPEEPMKRKFHVLVHHVPEKARATRTVGLEGEHTSESIHPVINKLERYGATMQNMEQKLKYIAQAAWLHSDTSLPDIYK